jgi:preprotein translocase subunit SecE
VARDRQRAKARKARRAQNPGPAPSRPHRENVPGELDHASGEVDRFEAELISGADGEPVAEPDTIEREAVEDEAVEDEAVEDEAVEDEVVEDEVVEDEVVEDEVELDEEPLEDHDDDALEPAAAAQVGTPSREGAVPGQPTKRGASRFLAFVRASWAELQRVQWPDRRQVAQATAVVLGFVVIAGAYLGLADAVAQEIVDIII